MIYLDEDVRHAMVIRGAFSQDVGATPGAATSSRATEGLDVATDDMEDVGSETRRRDQNPAILLEYI